jgi:hypothetical protein
MLSDLLASEVNTDPAFLKICVLGLDGFIHLRGGRNRVKELLLAFMQHRKGLRLGAGCRISTDCWDGVHRITPDCLILTAEQRPFHVGQLNKWYWANAWDETVLDTDDSGSEHWVSDDMDYEHEASSPLVVASNMCKLDTYKVVVNCPLRSSLRILSSSGRQRRQEKNRGPRHMR